jgi:MFS family permease
MTVIAKSFDVASPSPERQSRRGLDAVNFFLAGILAAFGPFVAVYLGHLDWSQRDIGLVLSAGFVAALLAQLPGGELLDLVRSKRLLVALGTVMLAAAAIILALWPSFPLVLVAMSLQGITGGIAGTAIAAISLGLVGHAALAERLGRNQSFRSAGSLGAAALVGVIGYWASDRAIFFATAAFAAPLLIALAYIRATEIHFGRSVGAPDCEEPSKPLRAKRRAVSKHRQLLTFAVCLFFFQMADASILPLVGGALAHSEGNRSIPIMAALVVVPQIFVMLFSPWTGRRAQRHGRRPLLLLGFAALPIRALLFTLTDDPTLLLVAQVLDGVSGMALGVLTPLIIADLTMGTGRYNLAQGLVGTISGLGAALSTTISGYLASAYGGHAAFLEILGIAVAGTVAPLVAHARDEAGQLVWRFRTGR